MDMNDIEGTLTTDNGVFRVTMTAIAPAPVQPSRQKRRPRVGFPKTTRIQLLSAQNHRCALCRGPLGLYDSHIDHVIPLSVGGSDEFSNLQLTHMSCNLRKGAGKSPYNVAQERMPWG